MTFEQTEEGVLFHGIHPALEDVLRAAAIDPWERCPEGSARFLPKPGSGEELLADWEDHVKPELRAGFETSRAIVLEDLGVMTREESGTWSLPIPSHHTGDCLITLNALRLALAEEHGLGESDLEREGWGDWSSPEGVALMQVNLFAFMQECLIRSMET